MILKGFWIALIFLSTTLWAGDRWDVHAGRLSLHFAPVFGELGLELREVTDATVDGSGFDLVFEGLAGDFTFQAEGLDFEDFEQGSLEFQSGFTLNHQQGKRAFLLPLQGFTLQVIPGSTHFAMRDQAGVVWFYLRYPHTHFNPVRHSLHLKHLGIELAPALADLLGRPDLSDTSIGAAELLLTTTSDASVNDSGLCEPNFTGQIDVALTIINGVVQRAREPGRVAISANAFLENVGEADVPWFSPTFDNPFDGFVDQPCGPSEQHPYLALNFYRILDGVPEQIGAGDVKHAFFSVNSGCPCQGDEIMFVGCGDLYSAATNYQPQYLGPRSEVSAHTGVWDAPPCNGPLDSIQSTDTFSRRLTVPEADLQEAQATYLMEMWYVVQDDINIFNSMGYLEVAPSFNGSVWSFAAVGESQLGPAVDAWVAEDTQLNNQTNQKVDTGEGFLQVASEAVETEPGLFRYTYAVMNHDYDPQIGAVALDSTVQADTTLDFGRPGVDSPDDWTGSTGDEVRWTAPKGAGLDWGRMITMTMTTNRPPVTSQLRLESIENQRTISVAALVPCFSDQDITDRLETFDFETVTILDLIPVVNQACPHSEPVVITGKTK